MDLHYIGLVKTIQKSSKIALIYPDFDFIKKLFLHCGKIDKKPFDDLNTGINKPNGLWVDLFDEEIGSEWLRFSYEELDKNFMYDFGYLIKINKRANIFILRSLEDFYILFQNFNMKESSPITIRSDNYFLDFNKMAKQYDGLYNLGIHLYVFTERRLVYFFSGWDVCSLILFNNDCYEIVEKISLDNYYNTLGQD